MDIFELQPIQCRLPLPRNKPVIQSHFGTSASVVLRVLRTDPAELFRNASTVLDCFKRQQGISAKLQEPFRMNTLFPKPGNGKCSCGCGEVLTGRKTRWYSEDCQAYAVHCYWILYGNRDIILDYLVNYYGKCCLGCGQVYEDIFGADVHVDHIIPVYRGGGACWLSNYQVLCKDCHKSKTRLDMIEYKVIQSSCGD